MDPVGAAILERDLHGDVEWTWVYPSLDGSTRDVIELKAGLGGKTAPTETVPFRVGKFDGKFFYLYNRLIKEGDKLTKITTFSIVLLSKSFNPIKWEALCKILAEQYASTGDATSVLKGVLGVCVKGKTSGGGQKFIDAEFLADGSYLKGSLKDVVTTFGVESILLMTAVLLKKRVIIVCPDPENLLNFVRALPLFAWHRRDFSMLRPFHHLNEAELSDLTEPYYIAGFVDNAVENYEDQYDIIANVMDASIMIADHAQEAFMMGKIQKELAKTALEGASNPDLSNTDFVSLLSTKLDQILGKIRELSGEEGLTREKLESAKIPQNSQNFLWDLAASEGLVASFG